MKKLLMTFALLIGLLSFQPNACANPYPDHLNGDPDYILTDGHMGTAWYMKKSSLNVEQYNPPIYIISVSVYTVNDANRGNTSYRQVQTMRFLYDWDSRAMYAQNKDGGWRYLDPNGSWAQTGIVLPTGEMAFYVAYRQQFYGVGYEFYSRAD